MALPTVIDDELIVSGGHAEMKCLLRLRDASVKLPEGRQSSRPHPDDEILIVEAVIGGVGGVEFVDRPLPVVRSRGVVES